ncbi:shikimate kinase [Ferruginibacter lapsinanis]|uniref:shikimate kinase n=1 Tax=Ferruginibacter lapsinanis TaxID=563172 RepID=UPI001E4ADE07|nr:shikimate kinase [Ferruginibacter lapsinanis]UEG50190.1 shikimate kinase [Ferruginibacter lapsinanis]
MGQASTNNIFLIGFMGTGKTHWGKIWSAAHNFSFIDLDEMIEKAEGKTVAEIFEQHGEDYFRLLETKMLRRLINKQHTIIACGGGTPCFHDNMEWMNKQGTTVYISSSSHDILKRVLAEQDKRPLLKKLNQAELLFFIEQKLKEREPFYSQATITLDAATINEETFSTISSSNQHN